MPSAGATGLAVEQRADDLRREVHDGIADFHGRLLDFAEDYAVSTTLQDTAVLLENRVLAARGEPDPPLAQGLLEFIDHVVEDHLNAESAGTLEARERAQARLRAYLAAQAPRPSVVFECEGLRKGYGTSNFHFGELDLRLRLGEVTGVVGQNAHGKTTMLRMVAGDLQPDGGSLAYPLLTPPGTRIDWREVKMNVAFVPQELPAWSGSLCDTLHYEAAIHGLKGQDNVRQVEFIVERLGLGDHLGKKWSELSGGYKLRFALARALVWKPRLLVMDEPLANLDIKAKSVLIGDVRDLARSYSNPIAVLMSSHDLHNLEPVCDQMVFLRDGGVVYVGDVAGLGHDRTTNKFEIGTEVDVELLRQRLSDSCVDDVREDGINLVLSTARSVAGADVLRLLLDRGVEIQYFRDSSRSVSRLFL